MISAVMNAPLRAVSNPDIDSGVVLAARYAMHVTAGETVEERDQINALAIACEEIDAAPHGTKGAMLATKAEQLGIEQKTLEAKLTKWRRGGRNALRDGHKHRAQKPTVVTLALPEVLKYCENDKNTDLGGIRQFYRDFRTGVQFGFGTWRTVWRLDPETKYLPMPDECPLDWTPRGWGEKNLQALLAKHATKAVTIAWNRQGMFAASAYLPKVFRSRVGLHVGEVYQWDDNWHNINVFAKGLAGTFQPLEFSCYDVASAFKSVSVIKPRQAEVDKDGEVRRKNLTEQQFRFAMAHLCCEVGFYRGGVTMICERGTTAIRDTVQKRVAGIPVYGKMIRFQVSGVMNTPAHAGLGTGSKGGNPRMKSLCECAHNIMHNATASLPGNRGRDAAHMHESTAAMVNYSERTLAEVRKLGVEMFDELYEMLMLGHMEFDKYCAAFCALEDEVMDRTNHRLEGWDANEAIEYRLSVSDAAWHPLAELKIRPGEDPETHRQRVQSVSFIINQDPSRLVRKRRMSRREVWKSGQDDLVTVPMREAWAFLDPRDAKALKVTPDGRIEFRDAFYFGSRVMRYEATYEDENGIERKLVPGQTVRVYWNPIGGMAAQVWVAEILANGEERVLGMCRQIQESLWSDPESQHKLMGKRVAEMAALKAEMGARHADDALRASVAKAVNSLLVEAGREKAAKPVTFKASKRIGLADLAGSEPKRSGEEPAAPVDSALDFLNRVSRI